MESMVVQKRTYTLIPPKRDPELGIAWGFTYCMIKRTPVEEEFCGLEISISKLFRNRTQNALNFFEGYKIFWTLIIFPDYRIVGETNDTIEEL